MKLNTLFEGFSSHLHKVDSDSSDVDSDISSSELTKASMITENSKYRLILDKGCIMGDETILYPIQAKRSFGRVYAGDVGGYVQSIRNLSEKGKCWIGRDSYVWGGARVYDDATTYCAVISGNSQIYGDCGIYYSTIKGNCMIYGESVIEESFLNGNIKICNYKNRSSAPQVSCASLQTINSDDRITIIGNVSICKNDVIDSETEGLKIHGNISIINNNYSKISISDNATIKGNVEIESTDKDIVIGGHAHIEGINDVVRITKGHYKTKTIIK